MVYLKENFFFHLSPSINVKNKKKGNEKKGDKERRKK